MAELVGDLIPNIRSAIDAIVASENISSPLSIDVSPGSQIGEGFASKTYSISVRGGEKTVNVFIKYLPDTSKSAFVEFLKTLFHAEHKFYEETYPEIVKFQQSKCLKEEDVFEHVPKHYGNGVKYDGVPPIVLENLRISGYTLRDFKEAIDDAHVTLVLKALARFHAISYAMKDQEPDLFKKLTVDIKDTFVTAFSAIGLADSYGGMMDNFVASLDPLADKTLLNTCRNLREVLIGHATTIDKNIDDYAVICQGDCWSNNIMFQYDEKSGIPINIKLIDWQIQRYNSPVLDVSLFFYTIAMKDILANFDKYFKFYYDSLADQIRKLGSDPEKMYPRDVFLNHWKKYSKFALTASFSAFMVQQLKKDELPNFIDNDDKLPSMTCSVERQNIYHAQMRLLVEHFVERGFL